MIWPRVLPYITTLFDTRNPHSLYKLAIHLSPHVPWENAPCDGTTVARWAEAASALPRTEAIGQSVVDTLLQIASITSLRPHIPICLWGWLKIRPSLPPVCQGRYKGKNIDVIRYVRRLGDIEILSSYFFLVWSEWNHICRSVQVNMEISIALYFGTIETRRHREELIKRLDYILAQLDRGPEYLLQYPPRLELDDGIEFFSSRNIREYLVGEMKQPYKIMRDVLLEIDRNTAKTLDFPRTPPVLDLFRKHANPRGCVQNPTQPSLVLCPSRVHNFVYRAVGIPLLPRIVH